MSSTGVERRYAPAEATVLIIKIAFEFPTEIGNAIFILAGRNQRLRGCFLYAVAERIRTHEEETF
jgi:hypothetical protein